VQIKGLKHPVSLHQPSNSEMEVMAKLESASHVGTSYLEGRSLPKQPSILVAAVVVNPGKNQEMPVQMIIWYQILYHNYFYQGTRVATYVRRNKF